MLSEQLAMETLSEGETVKEVFIDPATILLTAKIILTLISVYKNCKKSHTEATVVCHEMGPVAQRIVKREVRKEMGLRKYVSSGGSKLADKIINRAKRINESEMEQLYTEV